MDTLAAADRAYQHVKAGILTRAYPGGHLLTEGEVADAVGVSRTPVREAMLRLATEGLLRLYPKRGALVLPVSLQEVHDVLETRELVETHAAAHALRARPGRPGRKPVLPPALRGDGRRDGTKSGNALAADLRQHLGDMERHADAHDVVGFIDADRAFHHAIVAACGNEILTRLYDLLRDRQLRMGAAMMSDAPARTATAIVEHAEILAAVERDDPAGLRNAVLSHLATLSANVRGDA